ncbi:DUF1223 domain-containing protein [Aliiroseovarius sp. 2305UL8-7]|uniref:DUF1223 domain-containing protein n=1 Tax=Aliiroseovarius conchicola TaxID=3121637 RepID=UPI0035271E8B
MRAVLTPFFACALWLGATSANADQHPVTVAELFTSQGCSSCPPADELLGKLAEYNDILPLAFHVDYWDYIGWKDTFAQAAFTNRQKNYAGSFGTRSIYTPQMIIGGVDQVVGSHAVEVMNILHHHQEKTAQVDLLVVKTDAGQVVRVKPMTHLDLPDDMRVQLVTFIPQAKVAVSRGENAGRSITSTNVVTGVQTIGSWNGKTDADFALPIPVTPDGQGAAILLQASKSRGYPGEILAAIKLD